ncbi:hypothetical protein, partial [Klebsiella pneumoniae]|uniref:hypothetical protein n=1 Tax=Klebsiella pneumoniae TaxID=573 RepID=UPI0038539970
KRLTLQIESAKKCPVIFQNENISWYMRLFHCSREEARQELGYPEPLFTMTLEEYRKSPLRFG